MGDLLQSERYISNDMSFGLDLDSIPTERPAASG